MTAPLVLASTSKYRKALFAKLGLEFSTQAPLFDEELFKDKNLSPVDLAQKLAFEKAHSLANKENCVIGGDQLVNLNGVILGKPHNHEKAFEQLTKMSGKTHELITALCVIYKGKPYPLLDITRLSMRKLTAPEITNYLNSDRPFDCAGSYKIEHSGLTLFEKIENADFSAIQGLPLIQLTMTLTKLGYLIPGDTQHE